jgi:hypothetical protein
MACQQRRRCRAGGRYSLDRVEATVANPAVASVEDAGGAGGTVVAHAPGRTTVTLTYQRERASGA